jgi:hypothetical protein
MHHNLYHNKCINHAPTPVPNRASNHVHQHHTIYQKISSMKCLNHMPRICAKCVPSIYQDHQQVPLSMYQSYINTTNKILSHCTIRYTNKTQTCTNNILQQICLKTIHYNKYYTTNSASKHVPRMCINRSRICL